MRRTERICMSVPSDLLAEFDEAISRVGYPNRSKALQDAMRTLLAELKALGELRGIVNGVIVMIYEHGKPGLVEELLDIQHEHDELIAATMHVHLTEEDCLEVIALRGEAQRIKELADAMRTRKGVKALRVIAL
ncbi:nickel-responsive transcriptional regulator NikR [Candidatus Bathyarchaeota archaeon]|nr:MAG: nickel-responsive transcriptional regulator NikR [Candidatus Bathyarchaeota archaeon]HDJ26569.1 nickel-responsive transcriptional regulator NikR [Candidatus Bathyarchaeota archaeon]